MWALSPRVRAPLARAALGSAPARQMGLGPKPRVKKVVDIFPEDELPQQWLTQWYADVRRLMRWLRRWSLERGVCVIWKTNNVGEAPIDSTHPSRRSGAHADIRAGDGRWPVTVPVRLCGFYVEL